MTELRALDPFPPDDSIVDLLEDALARAKAGEFGAVAVCFVNRDGSTGSGWSRSDTLATLLGSITVLQNRVSRRVYEE